MNPSPSYYLVFFSANNQAKQKKVDQNLFNSLAQDDIIKEIFISGIPQIITTRRTFNIHNSFTADYFLIIDIILKPETK